MVVEDSAIAASRGSEAGHPVRKTWWRTRRFLKHVGRSYNTDVRRRAKLILQTVGDTFEPDQVVAEALKDLDQEEVEVATELGQIRCTS